MSTTVTTEIENLASLLHETGDRHHSFEAAAGPHDWWDWYAAYVVARQSGSSSDEAAESAARYMAEIKGVRLEAAA
ncbi:MAG: bleomycin resistance protein [Solirubrobacteraceae bacterium]